MQWKVLAEDDTKIILQVKTLDNKIKKIHLISKPGSNTIGIFYVDSIPLGIFDPKVREKATKMGVWNALLDHEVMHLYPEFVSQWYSIMDVLPIPFDINIKRLIPNILEDIAINHTLFRWEVSPIRGGPDFKKANIIEKLTKYAREERQPNNLPSSVAAVQGLLNNVHMRLLNNLIHRKKQTEKRKDVHIRLKHRVFGEVTPYILKNLNELINSNAVSLKVNGRTVVYRINIIRKQIGLPLLEARCNGRIIPQYVHLCPTLINPIYDALDIHFAGAYDIKVEKLRKVAYDNYKKTIMSYEDSRGNYNREMKCVVPIPRIYGENRRVIFDFSSKTSEKKDVIDLQKTSFEYDMGKLDIEAGEPLRPWERMNSIRMAELLRLKKWVE